MDKQELKKFVLDRIRKSHGHAVIWDWVEEKSFAEFVGDTEAEDIFNELLNATCVSSIQISIYRHNSHASRITRKRSRVLTTLVHEGYLKSRWVGMQQNVTKAKRHKIYTLRRSIFQND